MLESRVMLMVPLSRTSTGLMAFKAVNAFVRGFFPTLLSFMAFKVLWASSEIFTFPRPLTAVFNVSFRGLTHSEGILAAPIITPASEPAVAPLQSVSNPERIA